MTQIRLATALVVILGSGCTEPWHAEDGTTPVSTTSGADAGCAASTSGWTCQAISQCSSGCGTNLDCVNTCKAKGCATAKTGFEAVMTCVMRSCLSDCMSGFGGACQKCTAASCKAENDACNSNICPASGGCTAPQPARQDGGDEPVHADGGAATPADPPPAPKTCASCTDIQACASKCGTDLSCVNNTCKPPACSQAQAAFDAVTSCVMGKCVMSCLGGFDANCSKCASTSCKTELDTCTATTCPASCSGAPTPAPAAQSTCTQIVSCKQASFLGDDCASQGCASAQQSFKILDQCAQASCWLECMIGYAMPFCSSCITQSCGPAWQSCQSNHC